jgi:hypothetical protein
MNLLETILNAQNGDVVRQMANNLRLDENQARSAVGALVPALSRGIGRNASSPQGLDALIGALTRGNHSRFLENPDVVTQSAAVTEGNGILGHVFGSKDVSRQVASRAAESTGVDSGILKQMLPMLASVAMGALAKNGFGSGGSVASQLSSQGQGSGVGGLLAGFLDADKDGSILDDVLGMAGKFMR